MSTQVNKIGNNNQYTITRAKSKLTASAFSATAANGNAGTRTIASTTTNYSPSSSSSSNNAKFSSSPGSSSSSSPNSTTNTQPSSLSLTNPASNELYASSPLNHRRGSLMSQTMLFHESHHVIDEGIDFNGRTHYVIHVVDGQGFQWNKRLFNRGMSEEQESAQHAQLPVAEIYNYNDIDTEDEEELFKFDD